MHPRVEIAPIHVRVNGSAGWYKLELEVARRHVKDAEDRSARQEATVARMERTDLLGGSELGRQLAMVLRVAVTLAQAHLERLERGASNLWWAHDHPPGNRTAQKSRPSRPR